MSQMKLSPELKETKERMIESPLLSVLDGPGENEGTRKRRRLEEVREDA